MLEYSTAPIRRLPSCSRGAEITRFRCKSWAALKPKPVVTSNDDGLFRTHVIGILRRAAADHTAGSSIDLPRCTGLECPDRHGPTVPASEVCQRVISGVGVRDDDVFHAEAADDVAELSNWCAAQRPGWRRDRRWEARARKFDAGRAHIICVGGKIAEFTLQAGRPGVQGAVAKGAVDAAEIQIADDMARGKRGHVLLVAIHIHHRVGSDGLVAPANMLTPSGV